MYFHPMMVSGGKDGLCFNEAPRKRPQLKRGRAEEQGQPGVKTLAPNKKT